MTRVIAFDFGLKKTGVALGELELQTVHPITVFRASTHQSRLIEAQRLINLYCPNRVVIGRPEKLQSPGVISGINRFARDLKTAFTLPIYFINEDATSFVASEVLAQLHSLGVKTRIKLDALAACEILKSYFSSEQALKHP